MNIESGALLAIAIVLCVTALAMIYEAFFWGGGKP